MKVRLSQFDRGSLAVAEDLLLEFLLDLADHLLDAAGVDPPIEHQSLQREPCDLPPNWVEAGEQHGAGRVVHDQVHAGGGLEGPDVAPLASDDAPLHLVVGEVHN